MRLRTRFTLPLTVCMVSFLFLQGCSMTKIMVERMNPLMENMRDSLNKNNDITMAREGIPAGLLQLEGFLEVSPNNTGFLLLASEGYFGYSYSFVEDSDEERAKKLYMKGRDYALKVLKRKKDFREAVAMEKPLDEFEQTLKKFGKSDVRALFWTGLCWLGWLNLNRDKVEILLDVSKAEALLQRVLELDENYYYGSAHVVIAVWHSIRPKIAGGDKKKSKYHFDRAFAISESKFLFVHLMYAEYYTVRIQDRELYIETLEKILAAPEGLLPERNLANEIAKMKAKALLERVDEFF